MQYQKIRTILLCAALAVVAADASAMGFILPPTEASEPMPPQASGAAVALPPALRCQSDPKIPSDGPGAFVPMEALVVQFFWKDASLLEKTFQTWNDPACVTDDGRPKMTALASAYTKTFAGVGDWSIAYARLEELKRATPNKAHIAIAEAVYWRAYAEDARGGGYASSVTQEGMRLFEERMTRAEKVLLDSKRYAANNPVWYAEMVLIQGYTGRGDEAAKTFQEGARKFKTYYQLYFNMLFIVLPRWGGNWEAVDGLVQWSVENTRKTDGMTMYARMYWFASQTLLPGERLFQDTHASWPKMKKGFEDMMARHPKSKWTLNNFAKFACVANDKNTYLALRKQIGNDIMPEAWTDTTLDLCEAKFGA